MNRIKIEELPLCSRCKKVPVKMLSNIGLNRVGCATFQGGCGLTTKEYMHKQDAADGWATILSVLNILETRKKNG